MPILTPSVRTGPREPTPRWRVSFVTARGGDLLRRDTVMSEHGKHVARNAGEALLEPGPHPLGEELRRAGLGRTLMSSVSPRCQVGVSPVLESWTR